MDQIVKEVRIVPVTACPKSVWLHKLRRYRWQVTFHKMTDPTYPGVFNGRLHLNDQFGYTFTSWGASFAAGRVIQKET